MNRLVYIYVDKLILLKFCMKSKVWNTIKTVFILRVAWAA